MLKSEPVFILQSRHKKTTNLSMERVKRQNNTNKSLYIDQELVKKIDRSCNGRFSKFVKKK